MEVGEISMVVEGVRRVEMQVVKLPESSIPTDDRNALPTPVTSILQPR